MGRGQSKWGEHLWPECYTCRNVKALGCFVFSLAWGGSLDVTVTSFHFEVHADFHVFSREKYCCVWISLWETRSSLFIKFKCKIFFFSEVKHYFKRMDHPAKEMIFTTMEFTCVIWLLRGMKSTEGQWVVMLHSSEWHMSNLSAFGVSKDTLWAVRGFIVHQG